MTPTTRTSEHSVEQVRQWLHRADQLSRQFGMSMHHLRALVEIMSLHAAGERITPGRLAVELDCATANITGMTDQLARRHLIERTTSQEDRRLVLITPTQRAANLFWSPPTTTSHTSHTHD
jgi:DNA-binding MarR family transcriptional regulator